MSDHYRIRPASVADLPLLSSWRTKARVRRWWGPPEAQTDAEKLAEPRPATWIAELEGWPLAYVQDYRVTDWSPHHLDDLPAGSRGIDLYIGDAAALDVMFPG